VPGLEGRFFGAAARKGEEEPDELADDPNSGSDDDERSEGADDDLLAMGEGRTQEDAFLTSANLCQWIINYKEIQMGKQVGMGSYGLVFHGKWKGIDVAVKRFIKQKLTERRLLEFRAEMAFLSELTHPNIVLFIGNSTLDFAPPLSSPLRRSIASVSPYLTISDATYRSMRETAQLVHCYRVRAEGQSPYSACPACCQVALAPAARDAAQRCSGGQLSTHA
jgi:hypothetical protein